MIRFNCDYLEGCHPAVLELLAKTNMEQTAGYGNDPYCAKAKELVRDAFSCPEAEVHFLVGGTQTNATVIASLLAPYEGVLCADTGHINCHETGAIEACGHKVLAIPSQDGTLTAQQVEEAVAAQADDEHVVKPGMVYISFTTEIGTLYSKEQLQALYAACKRLHLPLYIDGARLGYGLMAPGCDVTPADLAANCDIFTVGGTKVGALFGEAVVFSTPALARNFRYMIKQKGGLLAKGRLLGIQFVALMEQGLYFTISQKAADQATRIREALLEKGIAFQYDSPSNQQFPIFTTSQLSKLKEQFVFEPMGDVDADHHCVRICTSWATLDENVETLLSAIRALS